MGVQRGNEELQTLYCHHMVSEGKRLVRPGHWVGRAYNCVCGCLSLVDEVRKEYLGAE